MYQGEVVILILHQILGTNLQGNVLQLERRINNRILGVKVMVNGKMYLKNYHRFCTGHGKPRRS